MKLLKFSNESLRMMITDTCILKSPTVTGNAIDVAVDDNKGFAENDYAIIGEIGAAKSEVAMVNAAVSLGTALQFDTLTFPHAPGTPIYRIPYNKVRFYHADTLTGTKTLIGSDVSLDVQNEYTTIQDDTHTAGYLFFALYNSTTYAESEYSAGFTFGTVGRGSRSRIRDIVKSTHFWDSELDEATFQTLCDFAESEIFAVRRWKFREATGSFSTVASQQQYGPGDTGLSDIGQIVFAKYDGNPVLVLNVKEHEYLNRGNLSTSAPVALIVWNGNILLTPTPSEIKTVDLYYYRNSAGFADDSTETAISLSQAVAFRVLQELWAIPDPRKSQYFEKRYFQVIQAMKIDDEKNASRFTTLMDNRLNMLDAQNQFDYPTITI